MKKEKTYKTSDFSCLILERDVFREMLKMEFTGILISKFSAGTCPPTPLEAHAGLLFLTSLLLKNLIESPAVWESFQLSVTSLLL